MINTKENIYQRQQCDKAYFPYGVIYISKVNNYLKEKTFYSKNTTAFVIDRWQTYEIDDDLDFDITESLIHKYMNIK